MPHKLARSQTALSLASCLNIILTLAEGEEKLMTDLEQHLVKQEEKRNGRDSHASHINSTINRKRTAKQAPIITSIDGEYPNF